MIYLAAPYTHAEPRVRNARVMATGRAVAYAAERGEFLYSPILHGHHAEYAYGRIVDYRRWIAHGIDALDTMKQMAVLDLPAWDRSKGVQIEIDHCKLKGYPIRHIALSEARMFMNGPAVDWLIEQESKDLIEIAKASTDGIENPD